MKPSRARTTTILFSGHDLRFVRPFVAWCQNDPRWTVLLDEHQGHEVTEPQRCRDLLRSADVIFCEWCLGNAVWYSTHKLPRQTLVVRLHLQEMQLPYLERVHWSNVDALILICPLNLDRIRERYPFLREKMHLIYNPIDTTGLRQSKLPGAEFNLGLMGICPRRKGPHLAVDILARLKAVDRRYTLFIKGRHPRDYDWLWRRPEERAYYEKFFADLEVLPFSNSVVFETYGDDVTQWFTKIGFILSTSDFEGSHQSVAEGMASGAIPVIRNWAGAEALYPPKYVFSTIEEAVEAVLKWRTPARCLAEMKASREYARKRFDQSRICKEIAALIDALHLRSQAATAVLQSEQRSAVNGAPAILILGYLPPDSRGGYRIRIEQEIRALINHGTRVHLACLHPDSADAAALESHRNELAALGCEVSLIPFRGFFDVTLDDARIRPALDALQQIVETDALRIVHAEALYCARIGLLLKPRCRQVSLAFDCHGTTPEEERLSGAHPSRITIMEDWERRVLAGADLNVFVSAAMQDYYNQQYHLNGALDAIVPCCVADERFPDGKPARSGPGLPTKRPIIAYLGTMAAWQCGEETIRLFAQLHRRDHRFFFLLLVPECDHPKARVLMARTGLPEASVLLTERPHAQVAATLQRAHAGVILRRAHPVNRVASPTKFGEYLAAGLPVIMTDGIGDFSRLTAEREVGLVFDPRLLDLNELPAAEIHRVSAFIGECQQRRKQMARRCRQIARTCLHWDIGAAALVEGYRRIASTARADSRGDS